MDNFIEPKLGGSVLAFWIIPWAINSLVEVG